MIPTTDRAILVATIVAGFNANPDLTQQPNDELVDVAFEQADMIIERLRVEQEARWAGVDRPAIDEPMRGRSA